MIQYQKNYNRVKWKCTTEESVSFEKLQEVAKRYNVVLATSAKNNERRFFIAGSAKADPFLVCERIKGVLLKFCNARSRFRGNKNKKSCLCPANKKQAKS